MKAPQLRPRDFQILRRIQATYAKDSDELPVRVQYDIVWLVKTILRMNESQDGCDN